MKELLKHPLIAAVLAGIILSGLGWVSGVLSTVWLWLKESLVTIINILSSNIDIPVWLLVMLSVSTLFWGIKKFLTIISSFKNNTSLESYANEVEIHVEEPEETVLSTEEVSFLKYLVSKDGKNVKLTDLRYQLTISQLETEQILEALSEFGLVKVTNDWVHGAYVKLTREGRDFILGNKYART